jgi:dolichol-phosphate mannosyltransferase
MLRNNFSARTYDWARLMQRTHGGRFVRFAIVGTSGVLVNYAVLIFLVEAGGFNRLVAVALANEIAILTNFFFNNLWTFGDSGRHTPFLVRAARYNVFGLGGLLLSVTVLGVLTYGLDLHYLIANAFAIGAAMTWNYLSNARWTFAIHAKPGRRARRRAALRRVESPDALD